MDLEIQNILKIDIKTSNSLVKFNETISVICMSQGRERAYKHCYQKEHMTDTVKVPVPFVMSLDSDLNQWGNVP